MSWDRKVTWVLLASGLMVLLGSAPQRSGWIWQDVFLTSDQQGRRLFELKEYGLAALHFENLEWKAAAYYADENFQQAALIWADIPGDQAHFKRANALAHLGDYAAAADGYRLALQLNPDWLKAKENLALVLALAEQPEAISDYGAQEASELGADEIVFSDDEQRMSQAKEEVTLESGGLSSEEINALWLRRLQSTPADFLRLKFRYQVEMSEESLATDLQGAVQ